MLVFATLTALAMGSPWWEDYGTSETFLCPNQGALIIERNDAQASVLSGRFRTTLFRENSDLPGLRYGDDRMRVIIRGGCAHPGATPQSLRLHAQSAGVMDFLRP